MTYKNKIFYVFLHKTLFYFWTVFGQQSLQAFILKGFKQFKTASSPVGVTKKREQENSCSLFLTYTA